MGSVEEDYESWQHNLTECGQIFFNWVSATIHCGCGKQFSIMSEENLLDHLNSTGLFFSEKTSIILSNNMWVSSKKLSKTLLRCPDRCFPLENACSLGVLFEYRDCSTFTNEMINDFLNVKGDSEGMVMKVTCDSDLFSQNVEDDGVYIIISDNHVCPAIVQKKRILCFEVQTKRMSGCSMNTLICGYLQESNHRMIYQRKLRDDESMFHSGFDNLKSFGFGNDFMLLLSSHGTSLIKFSTVVGKAMRIAGIRGKCLERYIFETKIFKSADGPLKKMMTPIVIEIFMSQDHRQANYKHIEGELPSEYDDCCFQISADTVFCPYIRPIFLSVSVKPDILNPELDPVLMSLPIMSTYGQIRNLEGKFLEGGVSPDVMKVLEMAEDESIYCPCDQVLGSSEHLGQIESRTMMLAAHSIPMPTVRSVGRRQFVKTIKCPVCSMELGKTNESESIYYFKGDLVLYKGSNLAVWIKEKKHQFLGGEDAIAMDRELDDSFSKERSSLKRNPKPVSAPLSGNSLLLNRNYCYILSFFLSTDQEPALYVLTTKEKTRIYINMTEALMMVCNRFTLCNSSKADERTVEIILKGHFQTKADMIEGVKIIKSVFKIKHDVMLDSVKNASLEVPMNPVASRPNELNVLREISAMTSVQSCYCCRVMSHDGKVHYSDPDVKLSEDPFCPILEFGISKFGHEQYLRDKSYAFRQCEHKALRTETCWRFMHADINSDKLEMIDLSSEKEGMPLLVVWSSVEMWDKRLSGYHRIDMKMLPGLFLDYGHSLKLRSGPHHNKSDMVAASMIFFRHKEDILTHIQGGKCHHKCRMRLTCPPGCTIHQCSIQDLRSCSMSF